MVQREVDNARYVWGRYVELNRQAPRRRELPAYMAKAALTYFWASPTCRRDVEERAEQLKAVSNLSGLLAGFALAALMQFDFSQDASSEGVQLAFGVSIALTVLLEANAMVICSLIHASILRIGRSYVSPSEEAEFMARARQFAAK
jgi:calcium release-activated calcium channel protein 1